MKKNGLIIILLGMLSMLFTLEAAAQNKKNQKETVVFEVSMSCENCKKKIEKNISFEKGVTDLLVDLKTKTVTIQYKTQKTDKAKLKAAIEKLGFKAEEKIKE
ncbi:heavy-metal-associated domain-containing protein [Bacteroidales bacterium OttesenSCG-928-M11]|nr:heavy-metal-associated domain-containing protein [Bacteroidales bacterium OttesenSCG-928-M11]